MAKRTDGTVPSPLLVVAAAMIDAERRVLVQQRPASKQHGGLWEFPGGKVEPGETPERALVRELGEELGIAVDPADAVPAGFSCHVDADRPLVLLLYVVRRWTGEPQVLAATALAWHSPDSSPDLPMPPADRLLLPFVARLFDAPERAGEELPCRTASG